jgi:hypothetical protein
LSRIPALPRDSRGIPAEASRCSLGFLGGINRIPAGFPRDSRGIPAALLECISHICLTQPHPLTRLTIYFGNCFLLRYRLHQHTPTFVVDLECFSRSASFILLLICRSCFLISGLGPANRKNRLRLWSHLFCLLCLVNPHDLWEHMMHMGSFRGWRDKLRQSRLSPRGAHKN